MTAETLLTFAGRNRNGAEKSDSGLEQARNQKFAEKDLNQKLFFCSNDVLIAMCA